MASATEHEPRGAHQTKKGDRECARYIIRRKVVETPAFAEEGAHGVVPRRRMQAKVSIRASRGAGAGHLTETK